ncbi:MAG: AMP-binding protein [Alsobacter sp.]
MNEAQDFGSTGERTPPWSGVTLLDLFASTVQFGAAAMAFGQLPIPGGRSGAQLTYARAHDAVECLRHRLEDLALPRNAVVLLCLGATIEAPVSVLACLRAGLVPCLVPPTASEEEIAAVIGASGAQAAISCSGLGDVHPIDQVRAAAVAGDGPRFLLGFGERLPAGVIGLDEAFTEDREAAMREPPPAARNASHSVMTVEFAAEGPALFVHDQESIVALALALVLRAGMASGETVLSTVSPMTQAGLAVAMAPLLIGGSLLLQPLFSSEGLRSALDQAARSHVVCPSPIEDPLERSGLMADQRLASVIVLHRPPVRFGAASLRSARCPVVDLLALGERSVLMARRGLDGRAAISLAEARVPDEDGALVLACRQDSALRIAISGASVALRLNERRPDRDTDWTPTPFVASLDREGQVATLIRVNNPLDGYPTPVG